MTLKKIVLLILSLAGFFDSSYLTIVHYKNIIPPCSITHGCEKVLTSQFATIFGVPISLFGSLFFLVLIFLLLLGWIKYFKWLTLAGVAVSIVLLYIQAFVLHAFCQYCLLVEAIIFTIFIVSFKQKEPF
ncbi:MAG: hypothetical protein A3B47_01675 [Candidatus Levybacteria bacterium RIFCSPLOWO2_01_FULL_39_24]|nr:MAG: hypothetical protein A2800_00400 [Candidatus Levybacteria bacterium RIFCSPHIGHO2_01_FULL_40_16]OGH27935.1 MAG: hypothetical protein A3E12_02325 [Candidatus Levybacteria bacterium RIFCSPHIGHO2_12_FULL_39_9]OGH46826.1 MAG: hypothetical protein A3B47_01675 [Candidatus Levybacteria bacterium RIFCSPLOWO2_01_FULL_39_24]